MQGPSASNYTRVHICLDPHFGVQLCACGMYVCMFARVAYIHAQTHTYAYIHRYMYTCPSIHIQSRIPSYSPNRKYGLNIMYTYIHIDNSLIHKNDTYTHTNRHTYIRAYIHTYIHTGCSTCCAKRLKMGNSMF